MLTHYELSGGARSGGARSGGARSGAATGDNKFFRYSYVKTLYRSHYKRSGASGDELSEANLSNNSVIFFAASGG